MSGVKRGKDIVLGWQDLIPKHISRTKLKGYSTCTEIAKKLNVEVSGIRKRLKILREENKIEFIETRDEFGNVTWAYKD